MLKNEYLVMHDYGQGALWAVVKANSEDEIHQNFFNLTIVDEPPQWMDRTELEKIKGQSFFDIQNVPEDSWLANLRQNSGNS